MKKRTFLFSLWAPVVVWCGVIYFLSGIPHLRITEAWWDIIVRKIAHVGEYVILARLLARAFTGTIPWPWRKIFLITLVVTIFYACADEYHQTFVPGRVGCVKDVLIDTAGAWAGVGFIP